MRGISFEIPNDYGKFLSDILDDLHLTKLTWLVGSGESYIIENNTLGKPLFPSTCILDGEGLYRKISQEDYYLIFVDLKGFLKASDITEITTYQEFVESECQFALLIVDSSYVTIYAKDQNKVQRLYSKAVTAGYENIEFITDENDWRTVLTAF